MRVEYNNVAMRIGLLTFVAPQNAESPATSLSSERHIAEFLRQRDTDVVTAESPAVSGVTAAAKEAQRLHRADCDGVVFLAEAGTQAAVVAQAALFVPGPLLLCGVPGPSFFDAAGALEEVGVAFDRLTRRLSEEESAGDLPERVERWLRQNAKPERQKGAEAAQKLYGQRFVIFGSAPYLPACDPAQWLSRFGVTVSGYAPPTSLAEAAQTAAQEAADFCLIRREATEEPESVPDGELPPVCAVDTDANAALTMQILHLIANAPVFLGRIVDCGADESAGSEPQRMTLHIRDIWNRMPESGAATATFARITRSRGGFRCLLASGTMELTGSAGREVIVTFTSEGGVATLPDALSAGDLCFVSGDCRGAVRAACEALDIPTIRV